MAKKRANGEGSIRKRKDGRWEGRYTAGHDPNTGKTIYKNVLGKTQGEVKDMKPYLFLKNCGSLPQTSRYTAVRRWFVAQFPEFRKNPIFYLYNEVKVIEATPFFQQAKEEAAEKAAKKAMKNAEEVA